MILLCMFVAPFMAMGIPLEITIGDNAAEPVQFAADELRRHVSEASSLEVGMRRDGALADSLAIFLTIPGQSEAATPKFPVSRHEEAYRIYAIPGAGRAFTGNSPRAVLYAVYDFLESELGYRWYFPYPEDNIKPALSPAALTALLARAVDRETEPAYSFREREFRDVAPMTETTDDRIVWQIDWWAKLRMNRFLLNFNYAANPELWERWRKRILPEIKRRGMLVGLGEHGSYPLFLPPHRHAADHPDWYCELDGKRIGGMHDESGRGAQFCTTNTDAVAAYLDNFADFVRANPEVDFYYPAPNDAARWCECAQCRKLPIADHYLRLNNQTAEKLNQIKPGTRVMHLAYDNHRVPPENTPPHPMIDVDVACWGRDFAHPLCDPRTMPTDPDYLEVFRKWGAICRQNTGKERTRLLYHWKIMRHYWLGLHLSPLPILDDDFRCVGGLGLDGFDLPLGFLGIWTKALNTYVVANKIWNPELSARTLTERFFGDYYGEWAETARGVHELAADAFRDRRYGSSLALAWFPDTSKVRDAPLEGLGENARHAAARLDEALSLLDSAPYAPPPVGERLGKLRAVVRHARDEQRVLEALDGLMRACQRLRLDESAESRQSTLQAWESVRTANTVLAENYSLEEDEAGLYWGGASHRQFQDALERWRLVVEELDWHVVGVWETDDFNDSTAPVTKSFDVTGPLSGGFSGPLQVRFQYSGGELGATLRAVSLWEQSGDSPELLLSEDRHGGFAGYVHENAVYHLGPDTPRAPGARLVLRVELAAYAASGSVAARGCRGEISLGLPRK